MMGGENCNRATANGKLYNVTMEVEMLCYAASEEEACDVAKRNIQHADGERHRAIVTAREVKSRSEHESDAYALPWGGPGLLTVAEILEGK